MIELPPKATFTPDEAALHLSVSRPTIYRWIDEGFLPAVRLRKLVRIRRHDLLATIKKLSQR